MGRVMLREEGSRQAGGQKFRLRRGKVSRAETRELAQDDDETQATCLQTVLVQQKQRIRNRPASTPEQCP